MAKIFVFRKSVNFYETDAAGLVHFSNYFRYMEVVEAAFLNSLGFKLHNCNSPVTWQQTKVACEFKGPIQFDDEINITLRVENITYTAIEYSFNFIVKEKNVAFGVYTANQVHIDPQSKKIEPEPISKNLYQAISND